jgi:hypothetical protein
MKDELSVAAKAYGTLWRSTARNAYVYETRRLLKEGLSADERRLGVAWAIEVYGPMSISELIAADIRAGEFPDRMSPDAVTEEEDQE